MEAYPSEYTVHNLPLVVLSGLGERHDVSVAGPGVPRSENGTKLSCSSPECEGERAQALLQQFGRLDGGGATWNAQSLPGPAGALKYTMKAIGRAYTLPPRKAAPLAQSPSTEGVPTLPARSELHSPLSPLSPGSPIFPDGLFTPSWLSKHQQQVPSLFLAFFDISAGDSARDEQIKADINIVRTSLARSGFKTRFAAVLLSDRSIVQSPDLEERLSSIRRLTSLDSKIGLFFMPPMSSNAEIATFVQSIMMTLQPLCVEYYRELTKHARRKKARGGPPPTASVHSGAGSQSLSSSGWNCRYEVKQGVLAEFRQEMDVAERHYTAAIDELFSSEGIFEATASWSPRWDEARLLCDALAIRTLRCQLWVTQTTGAVQSLVNYRDRTKDLIDRRGKGSETYGWAAWEARWAEIMAQLVSRADLTVQRAPDGRVSDDTGDSAVMQFHMAPEKAFAATDRLNPFHMLHHSGYWFVIALERTRERRKRAMAIADEDRVPPGQSPASAVANRVRNYDLYLALDPHQEAKHDHIEDIARLTELATEQFEVKGQGRVMELLKFRLAKDLVKARKYEEAKDVLLPLWESSSWRQEEWHRLFDEILQLLMTCAGPDHLHDPALFVATTYEAQSSTLWHKGHTIPTLGRCLEGFAALPQEPMLLDFADDQRISPIALEFAFEAPQSYVGEAVVCQLTASNRSRQLSTLCLADIVLHFGPSRTVTISAAAGSSSEDDEKYHTLGAMEQMSESGSSVEYKANLDFLFGRRRTLSFELPLRESGLLRLTKASVSFAVDKFGIRHSFGEDYIQAAGATFTEGGDFRGLQKQWLPRHDTTGLDVLPKPPKAKIMVHGLHKKYYTDELLALTIEVVNEEASAIVGKVTAARNEDVSLVSLSWADETEDASDSVNTNLHSLDAGASRKFDLHVQAPSTPGETGLTIDVDYTLDLEEHSPLHETTTLDMDFAKPFDAQYNFGPSLYPGKWPSFFDVDGGSSEEQPGGIPQLWRLSTHLRSLAADLLVLHGMELVREHIGGDSTCAVRELEQDDKQSLGPGEVAEQTFQLRTQKYSLEDRRPTGLEASLLVKWSRESDSTAFTTTLPVPRLTLPVSEPRVLCTLSAQPPAGVDAVLQYHIENPSAHFLTFALTMEASEDFAFDGPKYRTLSLAPLSRHQVQYSVTLYDDAPAAKETGRWIWPTLQVMDSYYQKNLKVHAAGPDVKMDAKGAIGVWIEL